MRRPEEDISQLCEGLQHETLEHESQPGPPGISRVKLPGEEPESHIVELEDDADKVLKQHWEYMVEKEDEAATE